MSAPTSPAKPTPDPPLTSPPASNPIPPAPHPSKMTTPPPIISISPLLQRLCLPTHASIPPLEIASAFSHIFTSSLSNTQLASLLTLLHSTHLDRSPAIIAACAASMRAAAIPIPRHLLPTRSPSLAQGTYAGGLCDIVGTGGDAHSTFNISTTASILASPLLLMAKHGNRAQTSKSGSADVLNAILPLPPILENVTASSLPQIYNSTNYAFLFAPNFHSGMRHAATVRRELGLRTIFNILGPLANPVEWAIEARVVGVATRDLGPVFVEAMRLGGVRKGMVVCGEEGLDEISCAGGTDAWWIQEEDRGVEKFTLHPRDFGLDVHPLSEVGGGQGPEENARILMMILRNELERDNPILQFVLMNVAALLVVSGVCEVEGEGVVTERGPGGGRWKEGVRRARWCLESGRAEEELGKFIKATRELS